jgi:hypothetical protein
VAGTFLGFFLTAWAEYNYGEGKTAVKKKEQQ